MATTCLIGVGVLHNDWIQIQEGRRLLAALAEYYRVVVGLDDAEIDRFDIWAKLEGVKGQQEVLAGTSPLALRGGDERLAQLDYLRGRGDDLALLVDSDPRRVAAAMVQGVPSLLFCHPKFMRPEFRPDYEQTVRPWDDISAEIERQAYLASQLDVE